MNISLKTRIYLPLLILSVIGLFCACGNPTASVPNPPSKPSVPQSETPQSSQTTTPSNEPSTPSDRVDVVYFHRTQRCPTCLCFEERIRYVMSTYFQKELNSGALTFQVCSLGDAKNADIVKKYGAVGPQLFINTIKDGTDHIRDIQEIWSWSCRTNKPGFDQKVKSVIEQSLEDAS